MDGNELDPLYAAVFDDPQNGTPNNITQEGCLALALLGKEAWNAWRSNNPVHGYYPDFENVANFRDFRFYDDSIDFEGFIFGDAACFDGAVFKDEICFNTAIFGNHACFFNTIFREDADFENVQFGDWANFWGSCFSNSANFYGVHFGNEARFSNSEFKGDTSFICARFSGSAFFDSAQFNEEAHFSGTQFGGIICFNDARFDDEAMFDGVQFGDTANFDGAQFEYEAHFMAIDWPVLRLLYDECLGGFKDAKAWAEERGMNPNIFQSISFNGVTFNGQVNFSGRKFEAPTSFGCILLQHASNQKEKSSSNRPVTFGRVPLFHNCKLYQDTTFDHAIFPEPSPYPIDNDIAARAYRTLKLAFAQHQAIREEQRFFCLEMAEEAKRAPFRLRLLFDMYRWISDYGFSLSRPTYLLLGTLPIFLLLYSWLADLAPCFFWQDNCQVRYDLLQFTLMQSLPLPGLDKWSDTLRQGIFEKQGWQNVALTLFVMLHKAISLLVVFLFGLALRNLFKMK